MASNEVRIIGGKWKGRKLRFPDSEGLRPTLGRVRGSLFNWLVAHIHGARCLDLYAGSGALGFEALSRGASEVVLIERNRKVAEALTRNAAHLDASVEVIVRPALRFLRSASGPWDVIFIDPPFNSHEFETALDLIASRRLLTADGRVYLERPRKEKWPFCADTDSAGITATSSPMSPLWRIAKHGYAGDSQFGLLARG